VPSMQVRAIAAVLIGSLLLGGGAIASPNHYGRFIRRTDPIAFWRLGEPSGSVARPRAGQYAGTYKGAPELYRKGLIHKNHNHAPRFDGRDDRVVADSLTSRSSSSWSRGYTLDAWVITTTTSSEEHILAFNRNNGGNSIALFRDEPSNKFKFHDCEGSGCISVYSHTTPVVGKVYQVVVTVDSSNQGKLYVNGKAEASFTSSKRPPHSAKFTIGAEYDSGPQPASFWHGKIDEVAVYDHALSPAEVAAQWATGT
jgi:Concanavalin A-like lectin/glucanases superfamily